MGTKIFLNLFDLQQYVETLLQKERRAGRGVTIIVDEQCYKHCLPLLPIDSSDLIIVPEGEECKDLEIAKQVWAELAERQITRSHLLLSVGGGATSDLAAFVASTYRRGCRLISIPTTLIGMVDAAIGGKTAVNFADTKNMIGTFYQAEEVLVAPTFLETLPPLELLSGWGEVVKYALLGVKGLGYREICHLLPLEMGTTVVTPELLNASISFKESIVAKDLEDKGIRHQLNLGHTIGHALEALLRNKGDEIKHGIAVAAGLSIALYLSYRLAQYPKERMVCWQRYIQEAFPPVHFTCDDYQDLLYLAQADKKNSLANEITMALLDANGTPSTYRGVSWKEIEGALDFYRDFHRL